MKPKISIITPCFNAVKYIEQTILSIINQGYENLEYIIIDGGSSDGTVDIIKKYENKITYWVSEPDNGQSDAINKGIKISTGEIFNWINADDWLADNVLNSVGDYFQNNDLNILCGRTFFVNPDNSMYINVSTDCKGDPKKLLNTRGLNQMGMFWRMNVIKSLNGVNTAFKYAMDLDLWKRYLLTYGIHNTISVDLIIGYFRLHMDSKTGIDMNVNSSFFDFENNAALRQYALLAGSNYYKGIQILYPYSDDDLSLVKPISNLPVENIKDWMNHLFYERAKSLFYANQFKNAYKLLKNIDVHYLNEVDRKNSRSFLRWSTIKRFF